MPGHRATSRRQNYRAIQNCPRRPSFVCKYMCVIGFVILNKNLKRKRSLAPSFVYCFLGTILLCLLRIRISIRAVDIPLEKEKKKPARRWLEPLSSG